jgi:hypothetical protein
VNGLSFDELVARTSTFEWQRGYLADALADEQRLGRVAFDGSRYSLTPQGLTEVRGPLLGVTRTAEGS